MVDVALRGVGATTPASRRLRSAFYNKKNRKNSLIRRMVPLKFLSYSHSQVNQTLIKNQRPAAEMASAPSTGHPHTPALLVVANSVKTVCFNRSRFYF